MEIIDIKDWLHQIFIPRRKREAELAERLFGHKLLGWCYIDHDYGIMKGPDSVYIKNTPDAVLDPVYLKCCKCQEMDRRYLEHNLLETLNEYKVLGHHQDCLEEIPNFSTDPHDLLVLMEELRKHGEPLLRRELNEWYACLALPQRVYSVLRPTAPEAVFEVAMEYLNHESV